MDAPFNCACSIVAVESVNGCGGYPANKIYGDVAAPSLLMSLVMRYYRGYY